MSLRKRKSMKQQKNPTLDLDQLKSDYRQGYSAMGQPDQAYYLTSWRGMESLQAYCTSEMVHAYDGGQHIYDIREVQVKDGGDRYSMKTWKYDQYTSKLQQGLHDIGSKFYLSPMEFDDKLYAEVLNKTYDGQLDRTALVEAMTNMETSGIRYDVEWSMKDDIIRARDGATDERAQAGAVAYTRVLAGIARMSALVYGEDPNDDSLMNRRFQTNSNDEWLRQAGATYVNELLPQDDGSGTVHMDDAQRVLTMVRDLENETDAINYRNEEWDKIVAYMQRGVVFMMDVQKTDRNLGKGMRYESEVHEAFSISEQDDYNKTYDVAEEETSELTIIEDVVDHTVPATIVEDDDDLEL